MTLDFPWPPTTNHLFATVGRRRVKTSAYNAYLRKCQDWVLEYAIPRFTFAKQALSVTIICHAPTKRPYDIDNRAKATLDALQACGIIESDAWVNQLNMVRGSPYPRSGRVKIHIEPVL